MSWCLQSSGSKSVVSTPMGVPETLQEVHEVKTIFIILLRYFFLLWCWHLHWKCKSNDALARIQAVAPNFNISHCIFYLIVRGGTRKALLQHTWVWWLSWGKPLGQLFEQQTELATFLRERTTNRQTMVNQTWVFVSNCLSNGLNKTVILRKRTDCICCSMITFKLPSEN